MKRLLSDTESHNELKQIAKKYLLDRGYKEEQVFSEYQLILPDRHYSYVIDVAAFKDPRNVEKCEKLARGTVIPDVIIECGDISYRKMIELKFVGKEVLWFPFGALPPESFVVDRLNREIERLHGLIEDLEKRIEYLQRDNEELWMRLNRSKET